MDRGQGGESYFLHIHDHSQGHHDHARHIIMIFSQWSVVAKLREVHQVQGLGKTIFWSCCGSSAKFCVWVICKDNFKRFILSQDEDTFSVQSFITWYYRHTDGGGHIAYNHKLWNLMLFVILLTCLNIVYLSFLRVEFLCSL